MWGETERAPISPGGTAIEPAVAEADRALASGSADPLQEQLSKAVRDWIHWRFGHLVEKKKHLNESVSAGREHVEAYVEFVHYVERLHDVATGQSADHGRAEPGESHQ